MFTTTTDLNALLKERRGYLAHYWFGGDVAAFTTEKLPGYKFILGAYGDVKATLIDNKTHQEIETVRDKCNSGGFYRKMAMYLDDEGLDLCLNYNHIDYTLRIDNNNWWECFAVNEVTHQIIDLCDILNAYALDEAVQEIRDLEDDLVGWVKTYERDRMLREGSNGSIQNR